MAKKIVEDEIIDLSIVPKAVKRFRIDKDNNKIIELDTSDINMVNRLNEKLADIEKLSEEYTNSYDESDEGASLASLKTVESKMRGIIDYIFDSPVCDTICGNSSIFSPVDGRFKFEYILTVLTGLYEDNMREEATKLATQVAKHTSKYHK